MPQADEMVGFETAHARVRTLCDWFDKRRGEILAPDYREATARAEFITPFFEALGWDVNNAAHHTIYEKDCVLEKAEAHAGHQRSADYAFRRPGTHLTAFFVETKKPSVDIRNNADCHQAVLYGWNASLPLVVLTDFEEFLILDARSRPDIRNATANLLRENGSYTYRDYRDPEKFTEIWGLFSRQAVADGSIDKAAAALPKLSGRVYRRELLPRGTRPVDEEFLFEMELWRAKLAKSLKRTMTNVRHWKLLIRCRSMPSM
jgi:adenine-specific DNA-methyltransferase